MYEFHQYNPALPQIITSFKGNQKLILGGYRYNIHHVKEGVKTWRCVCAKKLTGARSWCKGRAETWDNDSKGIPKGEHNHLTEHDLAELEYFKSQLIFAAIADPLADLNTLMDEASKFLSQGLSFGNRASMKKSLIVARKSAETGELKLGQQPHRSTLKGVRKSCVRSAKGSSGQHHQQSNGAMSVKVLAVKGASESTAVTKARQSTPTTASSSLGHHGLTVSKASKQQQFNYPSSASASSLLLNSSSGSSSGLGSSLGDFSSSSITESPAGIHNWSQQLADLSAASGVSGLLDASAMANGSPAAGLGSNEQILAAALFAAAVLGTQTATSSSASGAAKRSSVNLSNSFNSSATSAARTSASPASTPGTANNNVKRKSARVNGILQKLSNKAAAESSVSPSPPLLLTGNSQMKQEPMEVENSSSHPMVEQNRMMMVSVETQTDVAEEWKTADTNGIRKRRHGPASAEAEKESAPSEETDSEDAFGKLNGHHCCQRKVICCCCSDDEAEVKAEEIPLGCRKRAKLLMKVTKREVEEEEKHEGHEEEVEEEEKEEQSSQQSGSKEELAEQQHLELELFELEEEELKLEIVDEDDDEEEEEPEEKDENNHHSQ